LDREKVHAQVKGNDVGKGQACQGWDTGGTNQEINNLEIKRG